MSLVNINTASFDGNDLATAVPGLTVLATNPYAPAKRGLTINTIARTNKAKTNSAFYNARIITLRVGITRATRALLETSIDTLMSILQGTAKDLLVKQSGGTRKYFSTYSDYVILVEGGSYIEMQLLFTTDDHFGYDIADSLLLQVTNFTSAQRTDSITLGGSTRWQVPKILITWSALSGSTSNYVSVGNDATGQTCVVTRIWSAGDVLEIDAFNQTVKVNGTEVAFTGAIPEWAPGAGYVTYSDNFTSRTFSNTMTYRRRYV